MIARRILITGTTSGLGLAFQEHYLRQGWEIIAVNRRILAGERNDKIENHVLNITDASDVLKLMSSLEIANRMPNLFLLNAGINLMDNKLGLDFGVFRQVMETNLMGVLTFVGALSELGISGVRVATFSSTSNIIPNPGHVGYFLSKLCLRESFRLIAKRDRRNTYQYVVLGPVATNIMSKYPKPQGIQGRILDFLIVPAPKAAQACATFFEGHREVFYFPKFACVFYFCVRFILRFAPGLYQGSK